MTAVEKEERFELERVIEWVKQRKGDCMIEQGKQRKEELFEGVLSLLPLGVNSCSFTPDSTSS